jgi:hypothetical protein
MRVVVQGKTSAHGELFGLEKQQLDISVKLPPLNPSPVGGKVCLDVGANSILTTLVDSGRQQMQG